MTHAVLNRINPKGEIGVWQCARCKVKGTFAELRALEDMGATCADPGPATDEELLAVIEPAPSPARGAK